MAQEGRRGLKKAGKGSNMAQEGNNEGKKDNGSHK